MECVELETARLILRCPTEGDIDRIVTICQDADIASFTTVPNPYRRENATEFVSGVIPAGWSTGSALAWGIYLKDAPQLLGVVSLSNVQDGAAELGYWIDPLVRAQGVMTEAAARVVAFGFSASPDGLGLHRIGWEAISINGPSARVAQKVGFRWEGHRRGAAVRLGTIYDLTLAGVLSTDDRSMSTPWPGSIE